jgi:hypothetical protein
MGERKAAQLLRLREGTHDLLVIFSHVSRKKKKETTVFSPYTNFRELLQGGESDTLVWLRKESQDRQLMYVWYGCLSRSAQQSTGAGELRPP